MTYTIEDIQTLPEGQTFDCKSIVESIVENLSTMRAKIVWILWKNPYATAQSVSKEVGIAPRNVQEHFRKLQEMGIIRRNGGDFGGHWEIIE